MRKSMQSSYQLGEEVLLKKEFRKFILMKKEFEKLVLTKEQLDLIMEVANSACQEDPYVEYEYLSNGVPEMRVYDRYGLCVTLTPRQIAELKRLNAFPFVEKESKSDSTSR